MSQWHRDNPELAGTWADPWMRHESYRKALPHTRSDECDLLDDLRESLDVLGRAAFTPMPEAGDDT